MLLALIVAAPALTLSAIFAAKYAADALRPTPEQREEVAQRIAREQREIRVSRYARH